MLCISVKQMAKELNIGLNLAYQIIRRSDFYPAIKISDKKTIINAEKLKQWINEQSDVNQSQMGVYYAKANT